MKAYPLSLVNRILGKFRNSDSQLIERVNEVYRIDGLTNFDQHPIFLDPKAFPNFKIELERFKDLIQQLHAERRSATFYKFGDGDYYFLKGLPHGSAKPGNRALSKPLAEADLEKFRTNSVGCDFYMCELYPENRVKFQDVFPSISIDFPAEFSYICVASNWFLSHFDNVGIIGAEEKINLIRALSEKPEYKESMGFNGFTSFLSVPQKYSCDDLEFQLESLKKQLSESDSEIYLVGIGHLKSGVLGELKKYKNAIFIDVGSGIDALAGIIDTERPYFGAWTNFQLKNYDYTQMDFLSFNGKNVEYIE